MKNVYNAEEWPKIKKIVENWKNTGIKLVFTNGCFDILHSGHEALLAFAKEREGKVLVGLNSDASVEKLKGSGRPVNNSEIRAAALLKTGHVDAVVIYEEDTPQEISDYLEPDVLIKGDDYRFETTVGAPEVKARGGEVLFFRKIPGLSTTKILDENKRKSETNDK